MQKSSYEDLKPELGNLSSIMAQPPQFLDDDLSTELKSINKPKKVSPPKLWTW
jgi:hypothetical protein